jgi:hypothetical protein
MLEPNVQVICWPLAAADPNLYSYNAPPYLRVGSKLIERRQLNVQSNQASCQWGSKGLGPTKVNGPCWQKWYAKKTLSSMPEGGPPTVKVLAMGLSARCMHASCYCGVLKLPLCQAQSVPELHVEYTYLLKNEYNVHDFLGNNFRLPVKNSRQAHLL